MLFACSPANVGDARHRDRGNCEPDSGARRRQRAGVLFHASRSGASRHRSDRIDEMVFAPDGRTGDRLPGWSSGDDSSGRTPQTEARSARCRAAFKVAGRKPFSFDLATFAGTAGSPSVALAPSSVGTTANPDTERVAVDCTGEWCTARKFAVERKRASSDRLVTAGHPYRSAAQ